VETSGSVRPAELHSASVQAEKRTECSLGAQACVPCRRNGPRLDLDCQPCRRAKRL